MHFDLAHSVRAALIGIAFLALVGRGASGQSPLPPVPQPPENPVTEPKRVLGKILFWDEQLSSDNTVACGTCHAPANGGGDPNPARHPGVDGVFNTIDDIQGSAGLIKTDAVDEYERDIIFFLNRQVTNRAANSMVNAAYANELFWDGRAGSRFVDPASGAVLIAAGGALESQAVGPPASDIEMAHADRNWPQIINKLRASGPLALSSNVPADAAAAIATNPSYPALFREAFGDGEITSGRIAFAIAAYERTLISNQSPWDRTQRGEPGGMTATQQTGWQAFLASECDICHAPPLFTDNLFHNIGLRPNTEDIGREGVTGIAGDRGRFKTASLRNLQTRRNLMHTGQFTSMNQVFPFYAGPGAPGNPNRDPILPSPVPPQQQAAVTDFILNALTDQRVVSEQFPFDRPRLHSQSTTPNPAQISAGTTGSGGVAPQMIAVSPPNLGNSGFKIGLDSALPGATARVALSTLPPVSGILEPEVLSDPITVQGTQVGTGFATFRWPIPADRTREGEVVYMQWRVDDPAATGGVALSSVAMITLFGGAGLPACRGDSNGDFLINFSDLTESLKFFGETGIAYRPGDADGDGNINFTDISLTLSRWGETCF